jgi:hypothetical protein
MFDWWFSPSDVLADILEKISDGLLVAFTAAVLVGVLFEYLAEFTKFAWFHRFRVLWAIVIAIGLAGEMFTEASSFWYALKLQDSQGRTITALGEIAQNAKSNADSALSEANDALRKIGPLADKERALRTALSADEARIAPRNLTTKQQHRIAARISRFSGTPFDLAMQTDLEPMRLLDKVENSILMAGWKEIPPDSRGQTFNRGNRPTVAIRTVAGVWVLSALEFQKQGHALVLALRKEGLRTSEHIITGNDPVDHRGVAVWVGGKP